jgi:hypothetical protein
MATPQRTNFFQIPQSKIPNKPSKLLSFTIQAFWFSDKDLVTCARAHRFLASRSDPSGLIRAEAFWNSFGCGR